jgi:murein L,D-transpeptidase YafK
MNFDRSHARERFLFTIAGARAMRCYISRVLRKLLLVGALAVALIAAFLFVYPRENRLSRDLKIDRIVVKKSEHTLSIFRGGTELKTYRVALGRNPVGAKEEEGDMKTPEGVYKIDFHKPDSAFHLALHISYPSANDVARAMARGASAGSDIMIHGLPNGLGAIGAAHRLKDWTSGCIALTNEEIEELYRATPDGTLVEIEP